MKENEEVKWRNQMLGSVFRGDLAATRNSILKTDTHGMLEKVSKDLKLTDYTLSRCVTSGTDHFT